MRNIKSKIFAVLPLAFMASMASAQINCSDQKNYYLCNFGNSGSNTGGTTSGPVGQVPGATNSTDTVANRNDELLNQMKKSSIGVCGSDDSKMLLSVPTATCAAGTTTGLTLVGGVYKWQCAGTIAAPASCMAGKKQSVCPEGQVFQNWVVKVRGWGPYEHSQWDKDYVVAGKDDNSDGQRAQKTIYDQYDSMLGMLGGWDKIKDDVIKPINSGHIVEWFNFSTIASCK